MIADIVRPPNPENWIDDIVFKALPWSENYADSSDAFDVFVRSRVSFFLDY